MRKKSSASTPDLIELHSGFILPLFVFQEGGGKVMTERLKRYFGIIGSILNQS
jgi:hypothetical protein